MSFATVIWTCLLPAGGMLLLVLVARALYRRERRRRRTETPEDFSMLRRPGYALEQQLAELDAKIEPLLFQGMGMILGLALMAWALVLLAQTWARETGGPWPLLMAGAVILALTWTALRLQVRRLVKLIDQRNDLRLGLRGEQFVAEQLQALVRQGWWVFHDLPVVIKGHEQNIDHVAVGSRGLVVFETKTRSKPVAGGVAKAEVRFDGKALLWPGFQDKKTVWQVRQQAAWLADWVKNECGLSVKVFQMIVIPGWTVHPGHCYEPRVVSGKAVTDALVAMLEAQPVLLNERQMGKIADQLRPLCLVPEEDR